MPKRVTWRAFSHWPKSLWKRKPNSEYQTQQGKYRSHEGPAHMRRDDLGRNDPDGDAGPPASQECKVGIARPPVRQERHDGCWQDCR
jgi:hypothetical protein